MLKSLLGLKKGSSILSGKLKLPAPVGLHYNLSTLRWHTDLRTPAAVLLLHDFLGCSKCWDPFVSVLAQMPKSQITPAVPLVVYAANLRNHWESPSSEQGDVLSNISDIVEFATKNIPPGSPVHLMGVGLGGRLAALSSLAAPDAFASVTVIDAGVLEAVEKPNLAKLDVMEKANLGSTLSAANKSLSPLLRNDGERLAALCSAAESVEGGVKFLTNLPVLRGSATSLFSWPSHIVQGTQFPKQALFINSTLRKEDSGCFPVQRFLELEGGCLELRRDQITARVGMEWLRTMNMLGKCQPEGEEKAATEEVK